MAALRAVVEQLIDKGRVHVTAHAVESHAELTEFDKVAILRHGRRDRPDTHRPERDGVYICWAKHPVHGLCRGVYAVEEIDGGQRLVVITAFKEDS